MSVKKRAILVFGTLAVLSIIVNIVIIASNGGFDNLSRPIDIPDPQDLWFAGNNIKDGDELLYNLTIENKNDDFSHYFLKILFQDNQDFWNTEFIIYNESISTSFYSNLSKSNLITKEKPLNDQIYTEIIESSILQIKDITREPKFLVIGAQWDSINTGITTIPIKIDSIENLSIDNEQVETFVLAYNLNNKTSKMWISKVFPLPVQAEIYTVNGLLNYKYNLISTNKKVT